VLTAAASKNSGKNLCCLLKVDITSVIDANENEHTSRPYTVVFFSFADNIYDDVPHTHTHTHPFNGPFSGTTQVSKYQKGKTNLDFTEARDSEWQWHQLGHVQVCTLLQTDYHTSTPPLCFLQAGCPSCRPTNSVKALKAAHMMICHY